MSYTLAKALPKDFPSLIAIHQECFWGSVEDIPDLYTGQWWLMYHNSDPVAFCGLHHSQQYEKTGYLCRVGVSFHHRGRGLHKKLIKVRERWARSHGIDYLVTDTHLLNLASSNSLIRAGYRLWKPRRGQGWASYRNALYWWKKL